jgi:hypothetical protein
LLVRGTAADSVGGGRPTSNEVSRRRASPASEGGPAAFSGGKADQAGESGEGIVRRHRALMQAMIGEYTASLGRDETVQVTVQPSAASDSHTPRFEAVALSPWIEGQQLPDV